MIFEFIDSKSKQLEKRIQTIADDYRKNYEAETIFIVNARTSAEELDLTVWDINEINKWIKEYPAEYGHVCSWNIDRKRTTQDKEKFQISENLYRDDLYQKTMIFIQMQYVPASKRKRALQLCWVRVFRRNREQKLGMNC